jgi:magnesium-transporting ATPase (P-type)
MTAHGVLMTLGWSVFIIAAIIVARHFKALGQLWFKLHIALNMIGLVLILTGFIISFIMVSSTSLVSPRPVVAAHAWIGLITVGNLCIGICGLIYVALGFAQPVIGWYSDKVYDKERLKIPVWPDKVHWWLGRLALLMSWVAVPLGMVALDISQSFIWIYIAWVVVIITVFIMFQKTKGNKHEMELKTLKNSKDSQDSQGST